MVQQSVLIFAKSVYSKTPYDQWLDGTGIEPIILTNEAFESGYRHIPKTYRFADYDHNTKVEEAALEIGRTQPLVGIFARGESDILRAARLRDRLQLPGQSFTSALAYRNKVIMKDYLRNTDIQVPKYRIVDSESTIVSFIEENGYPVVIKPVDESGSSGVHVIRQETDLTNYLASPNRNESEIETFVEGQMYHVNGLVLNGEIEFIWPSRYLTDCLTFRNNGLDGDYPIWRSDPHYDGLVDSARKVVGALPSPRNMVFHAEFWVTKTGDIVFCEIASRTAGGMISANLKFTFGVELDKEWLYADCGLPRTFTELRYRPAGTILMQPRHGELQYLPIDNHPNFVVGAEINGVVGQRFAGPVKSGLFLAGYIVQGASESSLVSNMVATEEWFRNSVRWSD
jgi:ATP-grasp domain